MNNHNRRGRPPLGNEPRTAQACIRITPTEKATLRALCEREGVTEREVLLKGIESLKHLQAATKRGDITMNKHIVPTSGRRSDQGGDGSMTEQKLFYRDPAGLLHEIRTENGSVSQQSMNQAIREYRDKYGTGIPIEALVHAEIKIIEVNDDAN